MVSMTRKMKLLDLDTSPETLQPVQVAIYARVSTAEQAELGYSVEAQLQTLRTFCKSEHKVVYREFVDAGFSGKNVDKRPALQQLLREIETGNIQEVQVWRLDRLSRNLLDVLTMVKKFDQYSVKFRSYSEPNFNTQTSDGYLTISMFGALAEYQRKTDSREREDGDEATGATREVERRNRPRVRRGRSSDPARQRVSAEDKPH
jgi:DNA invertase Pin-like site-specific DNA recombinase